MSMKNKTLVSSPKEGYASYILMCKKEAQAGNSVRYCLSILIVSKQVDENEQIRVNYSNSKQIWNRAFPIEILKGFLLAKQGDYTSLLFLEPCRNLVINLRIFCPRILHHLPRNTSFFSIDGFKVPKTIFQRIMTNCRTMKEVNFTDSHIDTERIRLEEDLILRLLYLYYNRRKDRHSLNKRKSIRNLMFMIESISNDF
ncbi:unnamed protein product [Moneuplotes crassus]|uniref:Uncharacterized protein n=1 Tax=Euplotes crassus TaxID=5936 RepID=A0AAD1XX35_EUPCR|nr:unnamed protein product [Moneuplotes crassus]